MSRERSARGKPRRYDSGDRKAGSRGGQPCAVLVGAERDDDQSDLQTLDEHAFEGDRKGVGVPRPGPTGILCSLA